MSALMLRIYDKSNSTLLGVLENARDVRVRVELNGPGSGSFELPVADPKADLVTKGRIVRVVYEGAERFAFMVETVERDLVVDGVRMMAVSGRGLLAAMEGALAWPTDMGDIHSVEQGWGGETAAKIWLDLYDQAQTRSTDNVAVRLLNPTFTATTDSDGNAWTDSQAMYVRAGRTLLDVWLKLVEGGAFEGYVEADGYLVALPTVGGDKSGTVTLRGGLNVTKGKDRDSLTGMVNAALLEGQHILDEVTDSTSIGSYFRREGTLKMGDVNDATTLAAMGNAWLSTVKEGRRVISLDVVDTPLQPWVDFGAGDMVRVVAGDVDGDFRVMAMTVAAGEGVAAVTVELNSAAQMWEIEVQRMLRNLTMGAVQGQGTALGSGMTDRKLGGWRWNREKFWNNDVVIDGGGWIELGSGSDIVRLDATHATYRQWIGDSDPTLANFSVEKDGTMHASNADVSGTITATWINANAGVIGGFTLSSGGMTAGTLKIDSINSRIYFNSNAYLDTDGNVDVIRAVGTFHAYYDMMVDQGLLVNNGLTVHSGTTQLDGAVDINDDVTIDGDMTLAGAITITSDPAHWLKTDKIYAYSFEEYASGSGFVFAGNLDLGGHDISNVDDIAVNDEGQFGRLTVSGNTALKNTSVNGYLDVSLDITAKFITLSSYVSVGSYVDAASGYRVGGTAGKSGTIDLTTVTEINVNGGIIMGWS